MADNWEDSVRNAAKSLADKLNNAATLTVKTVYKEAAAAGGAETTVATLISDIHLDGDSTNDIPVRRVGDDVQVNRLLYDLHRENVQAAMEYHEKILGALMDALQARLR